MFDSVGTPSMERGLTLMVASEGCVKVKWGFLDGPEADLNLR
jgi:hypothetical protein